VGVLMGSGQSYKKEFEAEKQNSTASV
jgi:hypothetical protein